MEADGAIEVVGDEEPIEGEDITIREVEVAVADRIVEGDAEEAMAVIERPLWTVFERPVWMVPYLHRE